MKLAKHIFTALTLDGIAVVSAGCKPQNAKSTSASQVVVFPGVGVSLVPGSGWELRTGATDSGRLRWCLPILGGKARSFLREGRYDGANVLVCLFSADCPDPQSAVADLLSSLREPTPISTARVIEDSLRREAFAWDSGLQGTHVSFNLHTTFRSTKLSTPTITCELETRHHCYIVKNTEGRWVGVCYFTTAEKESEDVHQMIRKTLRLR